jgi:putative transposase
MTYDPNKHQRRSIRLPGYDYSQAGAYFMTVCTRDHQCLFGRVEGEAMRLNRVGEIAEGCWRAIPIHFADVELDVFVVMPNHVHGIIAIADAGGAASVRATHASPLRHGPGGAIDAAEIPRGPKRRSVGAIIGSYKSAVSKGIHKIGGAPGPVIWQRNYYEHIIRNDVSLNRIRQYILDNPARWAYDRYNPQAIHPETDAPWQQ